MKQRALQYYLENDFSVIPLGKDKRPSISTWSEYQNKKADEEQISAWWNKNPEANIGIVTGAISGVTVVDLDCGKADGKETPLSTFPKTYTVRTPSGGYHLYYKYNANIKQTANTYPQFPHVDIRNDGGYVVAGGSKTSYEEKGVKKGGEYVVVDDCLVADFPQELFSRGDETPKKNKKKISELIGVSEGSRNAKMASFIGKLLGTTKPELWDDEIFPAVFKVNKSYNPPLDEKELVTIWDSITTKELKRLSGEIDPNNPNDIPEKEIVQTYMKSAKKGTYLLAMYIVKKYEIVTVGEVEKEVYIYRKGMYARAENEIIYPEIQRILKEQVNKSAKLEVMHKIQDATYKNRDVFKSASVNLIPLRNGVYDIVAKKLLEHSPDYRFTFQFPIEYKKSATCPKSIQFMKDVLDDEQFQVVQEWIGYYFLRVYAYKKAIIFVGEGDTGKTTLLEMITHLLGRDNISSVSLQKMVGDKFSGAQMFEKHGNLVDELSAKDIHDTGQFKIATGNGSINGEYKFGNQFSFQNYSKLTFACNKIPDVKEMDDTAYFNRWMVIRFNKIITKKIPNFIQNLTTEEERSGLFNFAMEGLERLMRNGKFSHAMDAEQTKTEMMKGGSSIAKFASEAVEYYLDAESTKEDMYEEYVRFCNANNLPTESMDLFGKKFSLYVSYVSDKSMYGAGGKRVRGWANVRVKQTLAQIEHNIKQDEELKQFANDLNNEKI